MAWLARLRRLAPREKRLLLLLVIVAGFAAWKFVPRPWHPTITVRSAHYAIDSTAPETQVREAMAALEELYVAYSNRLGTLPDFRASHPVLRAKLYRNRAELRRVNPGLRWAEAFYRKPFCHAYYSEEESNPLHWMLHEATHQLNEEVAQVDPAQWLEEGVSEYFSTARFQRGKLMPGTVDPNTYPVWWLEIIATTSILETNLANRSVIPLRVIITGRGGPSMDRNVNLFYLHWWTLTHYIFEEHAGAAQQLLARGGGLDAFEQLIGPPERVQLAWHAHVLKLKAAVAGHNPDFLRTGRIP
jgi:hypothetical protein